MSPDVDDLVVTFVVGDEAHRIVAHHFIDLLVSFAYIFLLLGRYKHVTEVERQASLERHVVTEVLDIVKELGRTRYTAIFDNLGDDGTQRLL